MELITDIEEIKQIDSTPETLEKNKEHLLNMIPEFEYSDSSEERILDAIKTPVTLDFFGHKLDENSQRLFFRLTETDKKNLMDEIKAVNDKNFEYNSRELSPEEKELRYKEGRYSKIINTDYDAIKAIINSSRYLVVSRNPVDITFCSTNQNFGSCFSMTSSYGYAFGVPALIPNQDIFVCYLTKGKHQNFSISSPEHTGYEFRYMKMLARFFVYHCKETTMITKEIYDPYTGMGEETYLEEEKDVLGLGYIYPKENGTNLNNNDIRWRFFAKLFQDVKIPTIIPTIIPGNEQKYGLVPSRFEYDTDKQYDLKHKDWFLAVENVNHDLMNPYFDNLRNLDSDHGTYDAYDGCGGSYTCMDECNTSPVDKIENGQPLENIISGKSDYDRRCAYCEEYYHEDDMFYISSNNDYVCDCCYSENYTSCHHCGERILREDMVEIWEITSDGREAVIKEVCERCASNRYNSCDECGKYYDGDSLTEDMCLNCYDQYHSTCPICSDEIHNDDTIKDFKGRLICEDCYKGKVTETKRIGNTTYVELELKTEIYFDVINSDSLEKLSILKGYWEYKGAVRTGDIYPHQTILFKRGENHNTCFTINWKF